MSIQGFESYSQSLSEVEQEKVLPIMIRVLEQLQENQYIKAVEMISIINERCQEEEIINFSARRQVDQKKIYKIDKEGARLRKMISHIRQNDLLKGGILIANEFGYRISNNAREIEKYISSCYQRGNAFYMTGDMLAYRCEKRFGYQKENVKPKYKQLTIWD